MGIVNEQIFHHYAAATINVLYADGPAHAVFVGTTGSLLLERLDGTSVTFANVPGGTTVPCRSLRYLTTSTAGGVVALYTRKTP
jgi:hypothetical protein